VSLHSGTLPYRDYGFENPVELAEVLERILTTYENDSTIVPHKEREKKISTPGFRGPNWIRKIKTYPENQKGTYLYRRTDSAESEERAD